MAVENNISLDQREGVAVRKNLKIMDIIKIPRHGERMVDLVVLAPFVILCVLFLFLPVLSVIDGSLKVDGQDVYSLENYKTIFESRLFRQSIGNSIKISGISTILGMMISMQGAYSFTKLNEGMRERMLLLSNMTSNFAGLPLAFAFIVILGSNGVATIMLRNLNIIEGFDIYSEAGLIVLYTYFQIPLGLLLMYPSFDSIKTEWMEAASLLGAGKYQFWTRVGLPVLSPSIIGTSIILFANAMGAYATAFGLMASNYNLIPIRIGALVSGDVFLKPNLGSALAMVLTLMLSLIISINQYLIRRGARKYGRK